MRHGALLLGALVVALALGEGVARVATSTQTGQAPTDASGERLYVHDSILGWRKAASVSVEFRTSEYSTVVTTDSLGLRGPEATRSKPPGTKRVLLLGDSYLEGYSVGPADLVSTRLERRLGESVPEVEVLNAGTAGWATDQELLYFLSEGRALEPDVTVLLFYLNDVYYNARRSYWRGAKPWYEITDTGLVLRGVPVPAPQPSSGGPSLDRDGPATARLLRRVDARLGPASALYRLAREGLENSATISGLAIRFGAFDVPGEYGPWRRSPDPETARAWTITEALIARMRDEAEATGTELLVFWIPSIAAVDDARWRRARRAYAIDDAEWSPTADRDTLAEICRRISIECLDPLDAFRSESPSDRGGTPLYFQGDGHWTARGHDLAASLIAERVGPMLARSP